MPLRRSLHCHLGFAVAWIIQKETSHQREALLITYDWFHGFILCSGVWYHQWNDNLNKKTQWFGSSTVFQKHIAAVDGNIPAYLVKGKVLPPPGWGCHLYISLGFQLAAPLEPLSDGQSHSWHRARRTAQPGAAFSNGQDGSSER